MIATILVPLMGGSNVRTYLIVNVDNLICEVVFSCNVEISLFPLKQGDKARVIQTLTFMAGINTLLQNLIGTRLPTVMGSSFAFIIPVMSIINDFNDSAFTSERDV